MKIGHHITLGYSIVLLATLAVRPSFANVVLWRLVYRDGDTYHVDAVWVFPGREPQLYSGSAVAAFSELDALALVPEGTTQADDIKRFRIFSQGYLFQSPTDPAIIGDLRYALLPHSTKPLWGIRVDTVSPEEHVVMEMFRDPSGSNFDELWMMIRGQN
jgi:inner membrane protein|tara:strand:+ start:2681 stop:3157 length:477 start_codon:yes stop_codon:yes gene_type:complete